MDQIGKLLEHYGYGTPVLWASAMFGLFYWLDSVVSEEAIVTLGGTMRLLKRYDKSKVASALVEIFHRVYPCQGIAPHGYSTVISESDARFFSM